MSNGVTVTELAGLPGINFFGFYLRNPGKSPADETKSAEQREAERYNFDRLLHHIVAAADKATEVIEADVAHQGKYRFCNALGALRDSLVVERVSVFADSGLPRIEDLGEFMRRVAVVVPEAGVLPSIDVSAQALRSVWPPRPGETLLRNQVRQSLGNLSRYLSRMDWRNTEEWKGAKSERWVENLLDPLAFYLMELFADRFVDRNGVKVDFSLGIQPTNLAGLSNLQLSPELAGKVVSVLVEFLGDVVFRVPYYSEAILKAYQSQRQNADTLNSNDGLSTKLRKAVECGQLPHSVAEDLAIPVAGADPVPLDWSLLKKRTDTTDPRDTSTIVASQVCRLLDCRLRELDTEFRRLKVEEAALKETIDAIKKNTSPLQTAFTIHATGIQPECIRCQFLPEDGVQCDESGIGSDNDYAGLVGKLVALAAKTAATNVRAVVGGAVRGISLLSLDNEVVAEVVSAAAATGAKKVAEFAAYTILDSYIKDTDIPVAQRRDTLESLRLIHERLDGAPGDAVVPGAFGTASRPFRGFQQAALRERHLVK